MRLLGMASLAYCWPFVSRWLAASIVLLICSLWQPLRVSGFSCADKIEELNDAARHVAQNQASLADLPPPFHDYARFHATSLHAAARNEGAGVRYLVYYCQTGNECGGLGDRFKGMVTALYLAMVTRRVLLLHQWPIPLSDSLLPMGVDWLTWAECVQSRSTRTLTAFTLLKACEHSGLKPEELIKGALGNFEVVTLRVRTPLWTAMLASNLARPLVRRNKMGDLLRERETTKRRGILFAWAWRFLFQYSDRLLQSLDNLSSQLGLPALGSGIPWLGVQIRIGGAGADYTDPERYKLSDVDQFAACAADLKDVLRPEGEPGGGLPRGQGLASSPVYVASDQSSAVPLFIEAMVRRGWNASSIKYNDQPAFHVERSVMGNVHTLAKARGLTVDTTAEMVLLSRASCIVHGESGFATVAVDMSRDVRDAGRCERLLEECRPQMGIGPWERFHQSDQT